MKHDNSNIPNSCPHIDTVISFLDDLKIKDVVCKDIEDCIQYLEQVRKTK